MRSKYMQNRMLNTLVNLMFSNVIASFMLVGCIAMISCERVVDVSEQFQGELTGFWCISHDCFVVEMEDDIPGPSELNRPTLLIAGHWGDIPPPSI